MLMDSTCEETLDRFCRAVPAPLPCQRQLTFSTALARLTPESVTPTAFPFSPAADAAGSTGFDDDYYFLDVNWLQHVSYSYVNMYACCPQLKELHPPQSVPPQD